MESDLSSKPLKKVINKIYKRQWLEGVLFGWIRASKTIVPSITLAQAIQSFYKDQDITEEEFPVNDCLTTYARMTSEYYESRKSEEPG